MSGESAGGIDVGMDVDDASRTQTAGLLKISHLFAPTGTNGQSTGLLSLITLLGKSLAASFTSNLHSC